MDNQGGGRVAGVVLCGGRSSRMGGGDKTLSVIGGRTILARALACLGSGCDPIAINANGNVSRLAAFNLEIIGDSTSEPSGPLGGILAAMDWAAKAGAARVVTVSGDAPFLPSNLVQQLSGAAGRDAISLAATRSGDDVILHPVMGCWPVVLRDDLRNAIGAGVRKVRQWAETHEPVIVAFEAETHDPFFNVNTPEQLEEAEHLARSLGL